MAVALSNRQRKMRGPWKELKGRAERLLGLLSEEESELSLVLVSGSRMRELNGQFRGKDKTTDVLSFPLGEEGMPPGAPRCLGDVILNVERCQEQAEERSRELADPNYGLLEELTFLTVHGVLHLLGYDHEQESEALEMEAKERELFAHFSSLLPREHHEG